MHGLRRPSTTANFAVVSSSRSQLRPRSTDFLSLLFHSRSIFFCYLSTRFPFTRKFWPPAIVAAGYHTTPCPRCPPPPPPRHRIACRNTRSPLSARPLTVSLYLCLRSFFIRVSLSSSGDTSFARRFFPGCDSCQVSLSYYFRNIPRTSEIIHDNRLPVPPLPGEPRLAGSYDDGCINFVQIQGALYRARCSLDANRSADRRVTWKKCGSIY